VHEGVDYFSNRFNFIWQQVLASRLKIGVLKTFEELRLFDDRTILQHAKNNPAAVMGSTI
jgi:hypothetical protein